jgi:hypothetical protein
MTRDEALAVLYAIKSVYSIPQNRKPGWDRKVQARVAEILVEYTFGDSLKNEQATMRFLDATINQLETEDLIDARINRRSA